MQSARKDSIEAEETQLQDGASGNKSRSSNGLVQLDKVVRGAGNGNGWI